MLTGVVLSFEVSLFSIALIRVIPNNLFITSPFHTTLVTRTPKHFDKLLNPLRTVVPYMRHGKMKFDTYEQITITSSSLA